MNYIEEFCDCIAILNKGKIAIQGDLNQIKRDYPRNKLVVQSVETSKIASDFATQCSLQENGSLILTLASENEKKDVMRRLIESYDIDEVKVFEPSLNDIFVEYAAGTNQEEEN